VKAEDYLNAGIDRVWIVDPPAQTVTIFYNNGGFETLNNQATIVDSLLPNLALKVANLFN
jgi:Uma2 family endonuclease